LKPVNAGNTLMTQQRPIVPDKAKSQDDATSVAPWRLLTRFANFAYSLMFGCVFVIFAYKIVMRYAAGDAVAWADEVSVVLFVWILFWGNAFVVSDHQQIRFDLVYRLLPEGGRRLAAMARLIIVGGLFLWALPSVVDYILFLWRERTPVLGLRLDVAYSCFGLFVAAIAIRSAWSLVNLVRPGWRRYI
jgi:TRAP-type C4-dicarboxylate transport system permease small subunit